MVRVIAIDTAYFGTEQIYLAGMATYDKANNKTLTRTVTDNTKDYDDHGISNSMLEQMKDEFGMGDSIVLTWGGPELVAISAHPNRELVKGIKVFDLERIINCIFPVSSLVRTCKMLGLDSTKGTCPTQDARKIMSVWEAMKKVTPEVRYSIDWVRVIKSFKDRNLFLNKKVFSNLGLDKLYSLLTKYYREFEKELTHDILKDYRLQIIKRDSRRLEELKKVSHLGELGHVVMHYRYTKRVLTRTESITGFLKSNPAKFKDDVQYLNYKYREDLRAYWKNDEYLRMYNRPKSKKKSAEKRALNY